MAQITFGSNGTPSLPNLDANFTELYAMLSGTSVSQLIGCKPSAGGGAFYFGTSNANAAARNWVIRSNSVVYGDLDFRQSNALGGDPISAGTSKLYIDASGNLIPLLQSSAPSLSTNGQMVFSLTSNTNLRISVRGSDGTTRVANITLA